MTTLNSGMHFLTGIAAYLGAPIAAPMFQASTGPRMRRRRAANHMPNTPLSEREKKELMESIRHDDWHE